nr:hypothetical protein [Tanacetum cinerariifolium]
MTNAGTRLNDNLDFTKQQGKSSNPGNDTDAKGEKINKSGSDYDIIIVKSSHDKDKTAVALMANLSHYGSDDLAEVHNQDNVIHNVINQVVQAMPLSEQSNIVNQSETKITSDSNIIPYS